MAAASLLTASDRIFCLSAETRHIRRVEALASVHLTQQCRRVTCHPSLLIVHMRLRLHVHSHSVRYLRCSFASPPDRADNQLERQAPERAEEPEAYAPGPVDGARSDNYSTQNSSTPYLNIHTVFVTGEDEYSRYNYRRYTYEA